LVQLIICYLTCKGIDLDDLVMAAPDAGGSKRANAYAKFLNLELAHLLQAKKKSQRN
jgi:phosphoribosylpyrophosphate synthetase